ncbi:putative bifunctional diguanylate cyclase/phosphodiesterase [Noviherbaspirillum suwonense]|uniref:Diguanylate cyclase (GGDEF) domain-containing protein n=1 Tax=Noviherbaspirillum suwonense TaxID=1224511 RepID=A0ABY1QWJ4_9BURK|nr:bifunctional diguanylate cyclase/phosphodiesterase [Noviherbaspirillum suwonense]SMP80854.1 diguanylate cyclase (GGDEF) domain-containing protein [Noviherbaspirillum suwonense]
MPIEVVDENETLMQFLYRAPIGLVQTSINGDVEMLNPMSSRLLMPLAPSGNLDNLFSVIEPLLPGLRQTVAEFRGDAGVLYDAVRVHLGAAFDGTDMPQVLSVSIMKVDAGRLMVVLADVTLETQREQDNIARKLRHAAHVDTLTRMPNRAAICERLQRMIENNRSGTCYGAVLFLNCDRFKQINDALGHAMGDQVLGMMADRLRTTLRQSDLVSISTEPDERLAGRIGSDEFVVLLERIRRLSDVEQIASRLQAQLAVPYLVDAQTITCHVSMGAVLLNVASHDADTVLQDASIAMVNAKRAGGARHVFFDQAMRGQAERRSGLEADLRRALAEKELFVVYQPVVGLQPGAGVDRGTGVEALVRWRHPKRGIVGPVEFIGIAEECGLIGALGDYVLAAACEDFMRWRTSLGPRAPRLLAVNLSRAQVAETGWTSTVREILLATGMPPHQLQLEVTESLAAQDTAVQRHLHELKALGVKLALDDFGTGYSSLASLHLLPVDTVKIDRSFVSQADTSAHHRVLIEATVRVAHSLGMDTVAEGIETEAQSRVVTELGSDKGQGYLYSRPLAGPDLEAWLLAE